MKIAIVSKADSHGGGASRVASDLHNLFNSAGHLADHWLLEESVPGTKTRNIYGSGLRKSLFYRINGLQRSIGLVELLPVELAQLGPAILKGEYDVVHFHDISSAISPLTVLASSLLVPTLWTFHDFSPFTGGCFYPMGCTKYLKDCKDCPQRDDWPLGGRFDFADRLLQIKKLVHSIGKHTNITPSHWMADTAYNSGSLQNKPNVIPNGVDIRKFQISDRKKLRQELGIPVDRKAVLLIADYLEDPRKGISYALDALKAVKDRHDPFIIVIGRKHDAFLEAISNFDSYIAGYIASDEVKSRLFSAADVFLFCSLADNLPLTVLETAACGVPTVGFATGGIPEMVLQNQSGYLVTQRDTKALSEALNLALSDDNAQKWGEQARRLIEDKFSLELMYKRHLEAYETSISGFRRDAFTAILSKTFCGLHRQ